MVVNNKFNIWVLVVSVELLFVFLSMYLGFLSALISSDVSQLGLISTGIFGILSIFIGISAYEDSTPKEYQWFIADSFLTVGMLGTVIGLILAFSTFPQLDFSDLASVKGVVSSIATGISTALYTTLVGLVLSLFTKIQLIVLDDS